MSNLLVVDGDERQRERLVNFFSGNGSAIVGVADDRQALELQSERVFDVVVADLQSLGTPSAVFVERAIESDRTCQVILCHDEDRAGEAVAAVSQGAFDAIRKPYRLAELYLKVERAIQAKRLQQEAQSLRGERNLIYHTGDFVGHSPAIQQVLLTVHKVTRSDASVLLRGESGTGKEMIAGALHYNSHRSREAFVRVNCAALPEELLESELFGHERGAFTGADKQRIGRFEQADGGSIFLDEIGDMSLRTQAKVLRVLQEKQFERVGGSRTISVDVRVISATNKDLEAEISAGNFREDLFYRLNVVTITLPPLRERPEDLIPLVDFFIRRYSTDMKKPIHGITDAARDALRAYPWPGNIRQLQNTIERAVLLADSDVLDAGDLGLPGVSARSAPGAAGPSAPIAARGGASDGPTAGSPSGDVAAPDRSSPSGAVPALPSQPDDADERHRLVYLPPAGASLAEIERAAILEALARTNWSQKAAAELLDVSRRALNYKIQQHGITHHSWKRNV